VAAVAEGEARRPVFAVEALRVGPCLAAWGEGGWFWWCGVLCGGSLADRGLGIGR
jgi:hypothetical protein